MPIGAFIQCTKGDLTAVAKTKPFTPAGCLASWERLYNEYLKLHPHPPEYLHYLSKYLQALKSYESVLAGDKSMEVLGDMYLHEATTLLGEKGDKIEVVCASLSKAMGFPIRANECSVTEFYGYIDYLKTWQKND